jgi:hypothetical protein
MEKQDYFLKNLLVESLGDLGINFINKETGESENNEIIKELLRNENIKDNFYKVIEEELSRAIKEKYGI